MSLGLKLTMIQRCGCCNATWDHEQHVEDRINSALLGHVAYGVCPCCYREAADPTDPEWIAAADTWIAERAAET